MSKPVFDIYSSFVNLDGADKLSSHKGSGTMSDIFQQTFNNLQRLGIVDAAGNIKNAHCFHADEKVIANITANEVSNRAKIATLSHMLNGMCICEVEYLTDGTLIFYLVDEFHIKFFRCAKSQLVKVVTRNTQVVTPKK